jgi:hypothetical protein
MTTYESQQKSAIGAGSTGPSKASAGDALRPYWPEAVAEWARRVRADREQVERLGETETPEDFYAPIAAAFRADPRRTGDSVLDILRSLVSPEDTWLDIGAGGGRFSLPIALAATEVVAVEPSDGMLDVLREGMATHGISNIRIINERWPCESLPQADVALIAHVGNDIEDMEPFLDAMETSARRMCVAVNWFRSPRATIDALWSEIYGEPRATLPAMPEFLSLLLARGLIFDLRLTSRPTISYESEADARRLVRRQLWLQEGSEKDQRLQRLLDEALTERDGRLALSWDPVMIGVVTWSSAKTSGDEQDV